VLELDMLRAALDGTAAEWAAMHATELDIAELSDTHRTDADGGR
jgi:DNA-binding FadR family transcriptional regulator